MTESTSGWGGGLWAAADLVTPMAVRVAATLRLADHIAAGTRTGAALAEAAGADPDALARLLGHLVTAGVLTADGGVYALTSMGEHLRDDDPEGIRAWLDLEGAVGYADLSFVEMLHTVRTGEPGYPRRYGRAFWEDLADDPARSASFDALMEAQKTGEAPAIAAAYPWGELGHVVDVGGGNATLLIAMLEAHDGLRGTLLELPGPAARGAEAIRAAGLAARASSVAGSFFDVMPPGAGGYVLSSVLHNWDDEDAVRLMRRCAEAVAPGGKVLVVDHFGVAGDSEGDLRMLCYFRGRERGLERLTELATVAGLSVETVRPGGSRSIVELRR
ncbi:methyltransferase [Phytomonospora endophytica]|uniref:SAM-dependent methyltransferase n=1 Tax=Phytomonospora endophytica TaxID=714109 RepID=A0A841FHB0_9ACTN|nr:methyltransferase [Phytomonospora endophytica]MBB6036711.1 SAM-dependent methyltransferase [Phytomonospora endophytica]GIG68255.1 methyltransferase [Phytomonospora endophytica]